ncbi:hypothetical protein Mm0Y_02787 [Morganella morganii]|nr:hypothetical protein Mm0Y_02787 [Morganella morganii]
MNKNSEAIKYTPMKDGNTIIIKEVYILFISNKNSARLVFASIDNLGKVT